MKPLAHTVVGIFLVFGLACGGFFEDVELTDGDAIDALTATSGAVVPPSAVEARFVQTTGIDALSNGEAKLSRADADAWFATVSLPCASSQTESPMGEPPMFHFVGDPAKWSSPRGSWKVKSCELPSGWNYSASITAEGDPAWIWVHGMTL